MSQWDKLYDLWEFSKEKILKDGNSWDISYSFTMEAGNPNPVSYLFFTFGEDESIHPSYRKVNVIDTGNQPINLTVSTLVNPTGDVLGEDISDKIINSNLDISNTFNFNMYDETTTLTDEGTRVPFSSTIVSERKLASSDYIEREYIAPKGGTIAIKFENKGAGSVFIEYMAGGHRVKLL